MYADIVGYILSIFGVFYGLLLGLLAVAAYQQLAEACDYPLHLGITEAGSLRTARPWC